MRNRGRNIGVIVLAIFIMLNFIEYKVNAMINDNNRNFKRITIDDGLSQSTVKTIIQDSNGYMWIGTTDGLNKYNGNKFEVYKYNPQDENSLSGNSIIDLEEDSEGNLWVGTSIGLNKIDLKTNKISRYIPNVNGCNISHYRIRDIMISKNGEILVGTDDGLNKYDPESDNFIRIYNTRDEASSLSNQEVYAVEEDIYGDYWIGTRSGLNKLDNKNGQLTKYFADENDETSISHNYIYSLHCDELGNLWIGTYYGGLNKYNLETGEIKKFMPGGEDYIPGAIIRSVLRDSRGNLWVATDNGFAKLDESTNKFITYKSSKYNLGSIISNDVWTICEDKSGAIWIGTIGGVNLFNPENLFNYYKSDPFDQNSLSGDFISGIYEDEDGLVWVGTIFDGLNVIDRNNNKITRIDATKDYEGELAISSNLVREITGIDNEIWIATENGLNKYDKISGHITSYTDKDGLLNTDIRTLFIDREGILWIGTGDGLFSFDRKEKITNYSQILKENGLKKLTINDIEEDNDGLIWLVLDVESGLISLNKETHDVETYNLVIEQQNDTNMYNNIMSIKCDDKDIIWIGTDSGLVKFNRKTKEHVRYTEKDGLSNNFIYGILLQDDENLWVSTNYGLSKLNINKEKFINYDSTDGIQGNEFNEFSYHKSKSGELFFGGTNGLTSFRPEKIIDKYFVTPVQIEDVFTHREKLTLSDNIVLDHTDKDLYLEFFVPNYGNIGKIKYKYRLIGLSDEWVELEQGNNATYTNLLPGKYTFEVAARSSSGEWSEATKLNIKILTPQWKSPVAYVLYVLLAITIVYIIWNRVKILNTLVRQRTEELNHKLIENELLYSELLKKEKYKNNYFINLSHELRTPLNIISTTQNLIDNLNSTGKKIPKDKMSYYMKTIKRNCGRLTNLIDNIIYTSKIEASSYKLNIKEHDIIYLVEEVALSMKELVEDKGIELIIEPHIEEKTIYCDDVEIERVIINLISNAIKFTDNGGIIEVKIWDMDKFVKISVRDNGIGIEAKYHKLIFDRFSQAYADTSEVHGGSGLGLTLSKQLIDLHQGELYVESELGKGSEFIIILPTKLHY